MLKIVSFLVFILFATFSFSQQTLGLFFNDSTSYNGYTLFAPGGTTTTYLIDNCGDVVHTWNQSQTNPGASVYLLENGNLLRTGRISSNFNGGGSGGRIEIYSWDDDLLWRYDYSSPDYHHHHDVAYMPNGNILLIAWERHTNAEVLAAGRNPASTPGDVWAEQVVELKPIGTDEAEVVWKWSLWDHMIQDFDDTKDNYGVVADHPELIDINFGVNPNGSNQDWIHLNSVNYNPDLDQIILSSRHLNEIYIIDHSTTTSEAATNSGGNSGMGGDILFRWGNPRAYGRGTIDDQKLFGQHDAKWIPEGHPDAGKIMVFNNGFGRPEGSYSSVDKINPPLDNNTYTISTNEPFGPTDLFWTYEANPTNAMYSSNISGAHSLPNGNTFICVGREGNFYEVNPTGTILWHYKMPVNSNGPISQGTIINNFNIFRATRYSTDYPAFDGKDLTPGDPVELNPLPSSCIIYDNPTSLATLSNLEGVSIYNNPFTDYVIIKNKTGEAITIEIFDVMGRKVGVEFSANEDIEIPAHNWSKGLYVARIFNKKRNKSFVQKIIKNIITN